jgi:hypothetical protein
MGQVSLCMKVTEDSGTERPRLDGLSDCTILGFQPNAEMLPIEVDASQH